MSSCIGVYTRHKNDQAPFSRLTTRPAKLTSGNLYSANNKLGFGIFDASAFSTITWTTQYL